MVPAEFDDISHIIFWSGLHGYEKETIPVILDQVRQARCFIDVGANCGIYTVLGATVNPYTRIVAIEPVPKICAALTNNVSQNKLDSRVTILNIAVEEAIFTSRGCRRGAWRYTGTSQAGRLIRVNAALDSIVRS
jgi:FkbM family methyltransferase